MERWLNKVLNSSHLEINPKNGDLGNIKNLFQREKKDKRDEEHRVWYVGVTRTKQNLYIMEAKKEWNGYDI